MKKDENVSKEKMFEFAKSISSVAKNTAESVGVTIKKSTSAMISSAKISSEQYIIKRDQQKYESDLKKYHPIFEDYFKSADFVLPSTIRIVENDRRRNIEACENAVGFITGEKESVLLNVYKEHINLLGDITWYPEMNEGVYRVDPCDQSSYIEIGEYFSHLKKVRVDELVAVAKDLGAKRVEVILKLKESSFTGDNKEGKLSAGKFGLGNIGMGGSFSKTRRASSNLEVAAQLDFSGGKEPITPKLKYFKNESDIQSLVKMRMTPGENQILSKRYSIQYGSSSGISISEAEKIDAAITMAGADGSVSRSVTSNVQTESDTLLEYYIEF